MLEIFSSRQFPDWLGFKTEEIAQLISLEPFEEVSNNYSSTIEPDRIADKQKALSSMS